jgi:RNA polymerase sigma-70 factor, ECF subfamily
MAESALVAPQDEETLQLLERCRMQDADAYRELYTRYNRRVFNTAYRILGEEASAEDALQETMLNVYRGIARFRGESQVSTWISRITVNVCLGILRKARSRPTEELDEEFARDLPADSSPESDPLQYTQRSELRSAIEETFQRMAGKQAVVVRLHDMEGHTIEEIAEIVQCPVGTVKSRLFYGRQEFKSVYAALMAKRRTPATIH